jgi:hypothetical protein
MAMKTRRITLEPGTPASTLLDAARDSGTLIVEKDGEVLGAVLGADEYERFKRQELAWREDAIAFVDRLRSAFADVAPEEHELEVDRIIGELRGSQRTAPG